VAVRGAVLVLICGLAALPSAGSDGGVPLSREQAAQRARALAAVGRKMFFDPSLSGSGKLACSSCHNARHAYGPPNARPVQSGGKDLRRWGFRAAPSLRYLQVVPEFTEHYFDSDGFDPSIDNGAAGGLTWDGRVDRARDQARIPLLSPGEMANDSPEAIVAAVLKAAYAAEFLHLANSDRFATILEALEVWQQDYREFYPYSSKYDAWLSGRAGLSDQEQRGLKLFSDPAKGNCARCHIATRGANGTPPLFTDYGFIALGVPRNRAIPANGDPNWYDLGLGGPERTDLRSQLKYGGQFRTPTLRNVARRRAFFHNGVFHSLRQVVEFYAERDTRPEKWYPRNSDGSVDKFDDLPLSYRPNVETDAPFGGPPGGRPALNDAEIDAVVAFLKTLNDGFLAVR
jgi:cytochrome c peroxidase